MGTIKVMSLNGQDMIDLVGKDCEIPASDSAHFWRARQLAAMINEVAPDVAGLVEAPPSQNRTQAFVGWRLC